jgi:presenilin-like A22 family membrane protease
MKNIVRLLFLFILAHFIGLIVGNAFLHGYSTQTFGAAELTIQDLFFIVIGMAFFLIFFLIILKIYKGDLLFKLLESIVVLTTSFIVFLGILWYFNGSILSALILAIAFTIIKFYNIKLRNLTGIISGVGMAVMFSLFLSLFEALLFIIFMCFYDFFAVFVSKHMIFMAKEFSKRNLSFSLATKEKVQVTKIKTSYVIEKGVKKEIKEKVIEEELEHLELGTGDISLPLAFALVVFKTTYYNFNNALVIFLLISLFSALALGYTLYFVKKYKLFLPALPPIIVGSFIGLLIAKYGLYLI